MNVSHTVKNKQFPYITNIDYQKHKNQSNTNVVNMKNQKPLKTAFREYLLAGISNSFHVSHKLVQ